MEAGTGSLEPRHVVVSIRGFLKHTLFQMAEVTGIDLENRRVCYRITGTSADRSTGYDHLVVALGSVTRLPLVPGLHEHGFQIKTLTDAVALRDRAIQKLEQAEAAEDIEERRSLLHFLVVGANFTGVEVAGEMDHFLKEASRLYPHVRPQDCRVTLLELGDRILPALEPELSEFASNHMGNRGIDIRLGESVQEVAADRVVLRSGETLPTHTVIWCAGIAPNPLIARAPFPVDGRGYILCRRDLQVEGLENVWAIGDCAVNPDPQGAPYPATAQHAVGQGRHLARNLERALRGAPLLPCNLSSRGTLAAIGCRTGVARVFGIKLAGFPAWFLYRTAYLAKMPGWSRKVRVALDWTIDLLFSRDYVQLGVHKPD